MRAYFYILPALVVYGIIVLFPIVHNAWLSLYAWDGVSQGIFVGLENYATVIGSEQLHSALLHVFVLLIFYCVLPVCLGIVLAALMARVSPRISLAYRVVIFAPQVIASVAVAVAWDYIFSSNGPLNGLLGAVGLGSLQQAWLGSFTFALPAVGVIGTWTTTGLCTVLFLAGIQRIPDTLYDAVKVDGGGSIREFFTVTLPGLRAELAVVVVITMILGLRSFDVVFVTTAGGPGNSTMVPSLAIFLDAFRHDQVGLASATAVLFTVIILIVTALVRTLLKDRNE